MTSNAYISKDGQYRYWLIRIWNSNLPVVGFICCNPSRAGVLENDQTIRKQMGFAARHNFGGILGLNVGAYRATDPRDWRNAPDPFGVLNKPEFLKTYVEMFHATTLIAAWGRQAAFFPERCAAIVKAFPDLACLGRNSDGSPRHPLRLPYSTKLERFGG